MIIIFTIWYMDDVRGGFEAPTSVVHNPVLFQDPCSEFQTSAVHLDLTASLPFREEARLYGPSGLCFQAGFACSQLTVQVTHIGCPQRVRKFILTTTSGWGMTQPF